MQDKIRLTRKEYNYLKSVYMNREHENEQSISVAEFLGFIGGLFEKYKTDVLNLQITNVIAKEKTIKDASVEDLINGEKKYC